MANKRASVLQIDWEGAAKLYVSMFPTLPHQEAFTELLHEANVAFIAGAPRASIVIAGECLLRCLFGILAEHARQSGGTLDFTDRSGQRRILGFKEFGAGEDLLTFSDALWALRQVRRFRRTANTKLLVIKGLRNAAVHGQFPVLARWDPPSRVKTENEFRAMLQADEESLPEAYRFKVRGMREWVEFECPRPGCRTLKGLGYLDQFAAIQLLFLSEAIGFLADNFRAS